MRQRCKALGGEMGGRGVEGREEGKVREGGKMEGVGPRRNGFSVGADQVCSMFNIVIAKRA